MSDEKNNATPEADTTKIDLNKKKPADESTDAPTEKIAAPESDSPVAAPRKAEPQKITPQKIVPRKIEEYMTSGVTLVWVVNPKKRTVTVYRPGASPEVLGEPDQLDGSPVLPAFQYPIAKLFEVKRR